jgi:glycine/D-amino acid oxidase-like deaminating enzyme
MASTCDILILGGGVVGTGVAFALAQRRAGRVVLLEKAFLGAGASGKSTGILRLHHADAPTAALARQGLRLYEQFPDAVGGPAVFTHTGLVLVLAEAERNRPLAVNDALRRDLGTSTRLLTGLELMEIDPNAHLADDELAVLDPDAGVVEPAQVIASFAEAAQAHGAEVCQGVEVKRLAAGKGKVGVVETNEGTYECGTLVLAAGAWSAALARGLGVPLPVQACRIPLALFRRPADCSRRGLACADLVQGLSFRPAPGELIQAALLAGEETEQDIDPDGSSEAVDGAWLTQARQRLSRRYPALHRSFGRGGYAATCARTPDGRPILDRLPDVEGLYCAAGFGTQDVALAPAAGQLLADLIVSGQAAASLEPFRLARFEVPA